MKNVVISLVLVAMLISIAGCQTAKSLCDDISGTSAWVSERIAKPMADKARERDAKITASRMREYHAKQAAVYAVYESSEVEEK